MFFWTRELERLGFREQSRCYWRCAGRYGLPSGAYLSVYTGLHKPIFDHDRGCAEDWVDLYAFHVTFVLPRDRVHFYYREGEPNEWYPEGYTPSAQITRMGGDPLLLRSIADDVALACVSALKGAWSPRM